jgi:hypothetical protein
MASNNEERFWLGQLIQLLEDVDNQARFKKGSGLTKKAVLASLVDAIKAGGR